MKLKSILKEIQGGNSPIDGKSKQSAANWIRKHIDPMVSGFFKDDHWEPIQNVRKFFGQNNIEFTITGTEYQTSKDAHKWQSNPDWRTMPDSKVWNAEINFTNNKQKPTKIGVIMTAHGAGSVSDPMERYDVTFVMY